MAANPFFIVTPEQTKESLLDPRGAVARLAQMHAEAIETARLANLLGRALHAAIALPLLAAATVLFAGGTGAPKTIAWSILILGASLAVTRAYAFAIRQPFERPVLQSFAQDLAACLLYAGFAWGAGAFLALANGATAGTALLFVTVPSLTLAVLLRERLAVLLFLAPVAGLTAFACVLAGGGVVAALVLFASAIIATAVILIARHAVRVHQSEIPEGLIAA
ncbi:MAG: hypothetical protein JSR60_16250 [Proteobacteria bacterium]|nr:hypothetical protein [Pseudomonadota bacterium]